ncbi:hypothetical protein ACKKBG_A24485 [Auxenochlorella protothecoides x Auxenochlorella symbiontica]
MSSSQCSGYGAPIAQGHSSPTGSRVFGGSSTRPTPEASVGEVVFESMNTAEGGASVSAHPAATASQAFGETSGVSGSNFGPEPSVSQHVGSTADPCMAPGCSSNSVDEGSTLGTSRGAPELARVSSSEAMMLGAPIEASEVADGTAPGGPLFPDRPSDADIIAWENTIREAGPGKQALVGQPEPLSSLAAEYAAGSPVFLSKIQTLEGAYGLIRRTRGDGNCFFRSFVFAFIERMLLMGDDAEKDRVLARLAEVKKQLTEAGYEEMVMETPMDAMLDMVRNIGSPVEPLSIDILEQNMCSGKSRNEKRDGYLAAPSMLTLTMCKPGSQWNNGEPTQAICQTGPFPNRVHQQLHRVPHADDHQLRDPEAIRLLRALHNGHE